MITTDLHLLLANGVQFVRLGTKAGTYQSRRSKQGATHRLLTVPGSVLVEPLRKPRKNRRLPKTLPTLFALQQRAHEQPF